MCRWEGKQHFSWTFRNFVHFIQFFDIIRIHSFKIRQLIFVKVLVNIPHKSCHPFISSSTEHYINFQSWHNFTVAMQIETEVLFISLQKSLCRTRSQSALKTRVTNHTEKKKNEKNTENKIRSSNGTRK